MNQYYLCSVKTIGQKNPKHHQNLIKTNIQACLAKYMKIDGNFRNLIEVVDLKKRGGGTYSKCRLRGEGLIREGA